MLVTVKCDYGTTTLNAHGAVVSTPHLAMKFVIEEGKVYTIKGDQAMARSCYKVSIDVPRINVPSKSNPLEKDKGKSVLMMTWDA